MSNVLATTFTGLGGQFQLDVSSTYTTITQVTDVDFSGTKVDTQDVTTFDNTDGIKRFVPTLADMGDVSVSIFWNPNDTTHQALETAFLSFASQSFKVILPNSNGTTTFSGIITSLDKGKISIDKPTTATCKIKVSGPVTLSLGA